jgi:TRAP-type uncharacterized transport system substrate-binding protein
MTLIVVAVLAAFGWMTLRVGSPFPPRVVVMATGPEGGAFAQLGARYRRILASTGVEVRLVQTAGGVDNLTRLGDATSAVDVAFVEGGLTSAEESPELVSLGTVALEPLWLFLRNRMQGSVAQALTGKRIAAGQEGSATRVLARRLLQLNGVDEPRVELRALTPERSADELLRGEVDAVVLLTSWQAPAVRRLLAADGIVLATFPRADAYVALFPALTKVVLPTGVADLARNIPPTDVELLAARANLVARKSLHPALQYLLLQAAAEIHGGPEWYSAAGRFPAPEVIDLPLSGAARQFHASGLPFAYRMLPFWFAGMAEPLVVVLIPLVAVVLPIARVLPEAYGFFIQRRIFRLYGELKLLEMELERLGTAPAAPQMVAALEELARRANHLRVPLGHAQRLFILKSHISLAQEEVEKRRRAADAAAVRTAP